MKRRHLNPLLWSAVTFLVGWTAALLSAVFTALPIILLSLPFMGTVVIGVSIYLYLGRREKQHAFRLELEEAIRHSDAQLEKIARLSARQPNVERGMVRYAT
jgi:hypothetical protein